jgi:hypothetical protein
MKLVNTLNRAVIVIMCLVLIAALTALFVLPQIVLTAVGQWMLNWDRYIQPMDPWGRLGVGVALAVVIDIALAIVIILEIRRPRSRFLRVQQVAGGMANISTDSVVELLQHRLEPLPGVIRVTPKIRAKGNRVTAWVDAGVARGTNVPQVANKLIKVIQLVLTEELGLQIAGQPEVQVTVVEQKGSAPSGSATTDSAPAIAPPPPRSTFQPEPSVQSVEPPADDAAGPAALDWNSD